MDESQEVVLADTTAAPEQVATAAPEAEELAPEAEITAEAAKTFSQEDVDALIGKRLAREHRKWATRPGQLGARRWPHDRPTG